MAHGRSIELFLVDGRPDGLVTAKVFNWTGQVLKAPRLMIKAALEREEARFTGVYVLTGERDGKPLAYVGEAEEIAARIRSHDVQRDWWTDALFISTSANELNKAHVKYLESRLVELAKEAGTTQLENGNTPPRPGLSEAARANMEEFLDTLQMVLPTFGVNIFNSRKRQLPVSATPVNLVEAEFILESRKHEIKARAILKEGEFVVQKGSDARPSWMGVEANYAELHRALLAADVIVPSGENYAFAVDYAFPSPSAAAAVVLGRSANGRLEWKLAGTALNFGAWDAARLQANG